MDKTFSESWYRIAAQRICLRPGIKARRQNFRGERWIILENPFSNQYFRLRPAAYEFVARLSPNRSVAEVWLMGPPADAENLGFGKLLERRP